MARISVLTPCYNSALFLDRMIASVQAQTFVDWEMVVVDDGSTDSSAAIVAGCVKGDSRIRLVCQGNGGVCRARNKAYAESDTKTEYLLFLDADDTLEPEMLDFLMRHLDENPTVGMVYCEPKRIDANDQPLPDKLDETIGGRRWDIVKRRLQRIDPNSPITPSHSVFAWNGITPSISLLRRTAYAATPGFDESLGHLFEDTDLFLSIAFQGPVHYVPQRLVNYRIHGGQATSQQKKMWSQQRKMYKKWLSSTILRTPEERNRIADAWAFRERRLMPHLRLLWAMESIKRLDIMEAMRQTLRALKHLWTYSAGRRLLFASSPEKVSLPKTEERHG